MRISGKVRRYSEPAALNLYRYPTGIYLRGRIFGVEFALGFSVAA